MNRTHRTCTLHGGSAPAAVWTWTYTEYSIEMQTYA